MKMRSRRAGPLDVVRARLTGALAEPAVLLELHPDDLDLTVRLARRAGVLGHLAWKARHAGWLESLPDVVVDQLLSALVEAEARERAARWELDRIAWALRDIQPLPIVALKGCAYLLAGTPNAQGRTLSDVDLMIPEADLPTVENGLRRAGWVGKELTEYDDRYYREWAHELPPMSHVEREVEVDLHHSILMRTARLKPSSVLLFDAALDVAGSRFKVLAPIDMVLHSIVHLFYGGELDDALREVVDIDNLLRHFAANEPGFWDRFWPRVEALDLARPAFYGLRYARGLLGTSVPDSVVASSMAGAPPAGVLQIMDRLVPRALFPQHPDTPSRATDWARLVLYVRSNWVKMPPAMLARHLATKVRANHTRPLA